MSDHDLPPVAILAYPGVSGHEVLGVLAVLHVAGLPAEVVSGEAVVPTREGARLVPNRISFATVEEAPAVVVPGGDVARALADPALTRALRARRGRWVLVGGEALRLAWGAGLLEGRQVARLPGEPPLAGAEEAPARLVADGRLLTCLGGDALLDLALHYVTRERGLPAAEAAARRLGREHRPFVLGASQP